MAEIRKSKQRDAVYAELVSRTDHPTAEQIYMALKPEMPNISLATVYRNLRMLTQMGKIITLYTDTSDHFDATVEPHYHLYCTKCGQIYDLDMPLIPEIDAAAKKCKEGKVNSYSLVFHGICASCLKESEKD